MQRRSSARRSETCFWRTGGLSRSRRGDLSRNQSGATGPSGHERRRVHAVNGKQGFHPDGRRVRRVDGAPSCAGGETQGRRRSGRDTCNAVSAVLVGEVDSDLSRSTAAASMGTRAFASSGASSPRGSPPPALLVLPSRHAASGREDCACTGNAGVALLHAAFRLRPERLEASREQKGGDGRGVGPFG